MPGKKSYAVLEGNKTNINISKADVGPNSSLPSNASIEQESLLSNNTNVSVSGLLGAKSFLERVQCASDVSQLSILFPTGCLDNKKVKKKKKRSNLNSSASESMTSLSSEKGEANSTLVSNERVLEKQDSLTNFALEDSSKCNSSASLKKSQSSSKQNTSASNKIERSRETKSVSVNISGSLSDESFNQIEKHSSKIMNTLSIKNQQKNKSRKKINSRKVSVHFDCESSPSISEHSGKHEKSKLKANKETSNFTKKKEAYRRTQKVSVNFDQNTSSDADKTQKECLANGLIVNVDHFHNSQTTNLMSVDSEIALNSVTEYNDNPNLSNNLNETDSGLTGLRRSRRHGRSRRISVVFGVDTSFPSIQNDSHKINNESTSCNNNPDLEGTKPKNETGNRKGANNILTIEEDKMSEERVKGNEPPKQADFGDKEIRGDGLTSIGPETAECLPSINDTYKKVCPKINENIKDQKAISDYINSQTLESTSTTFFSNATDAAVNTVATLKDNPPVTLQSSNTKEKNSDSEIKNSQEVSECEMKDQVSNISKTFDTEGPSNFKGGLLPKKHVSVHFDLESSETFIENSKALALCSGFTQGNHSENIENREENFTMPRKLNDEAIKISCDSKNWRSDKVDKRKNVSVHMNFDSFHSTVCDKTRKNDETTFHLSTTTAKEDTVGSSRIVNMPFMEVPNERPVLQDGISRKNVSVHFDFDTHNTLNGSEGVLESNTKSYGPDNETSADVNTDSNHIFLDKENINNKDGNDKIMSRKSLVKHSKNKQEVSVHFEFDSTLKKDVISDHSRTDIMENGTTKELEITVDSNLDKVIGMNLDSRSVHVKGNFINKTLQSDVCNQNNILSSRDSIEVSAVGTTNIPVLHENCENSDKLKQIVEACDSSPNTDIDAKTDNADPRDSQHKLNSTYSIENSKENISPSNGHNHSNCVIKDLRKISDGNCNDKCEDDIISGNEVVDKDKIISISKANTTYTLTLNKEEIRNPTDSSLEVCDRSNKGENMSSPELAAESVKAKSSTGRDLISNSAIHSSLFPTVHLVIEKTNEMELVSNKSPLMNLEINNSFDKGQEIICNQTIETYLLQNKHQNHRGTLELLVDTSDKNKTIIMNNESTENDPQIREHVLPKIICDATAQDKEASMNNKSKSLNNSIKNSNITAELCSNIDEKSLNNCAVVVNSEMQSKSAERSAELCDNERPLIHLPSQPESTEYNVPNNANDLCLNELSPQPNKGENEMNLEDIAGNEPLEGDNLNNSGHCQSAILNHKENQILEQDLPNLSSVNIVVPDKISDVPNLSQIEDNLCTPEKFNKNNFQESLPVSIELDVSIRATSANSNCVALPSSPCINFTSKDTTNDSEILRNNKAERLDIDSLRSRDMTFSKRSQNSTFNERIPGVIQENLVEIPSLENLSDKGHKQVVSEDISLSPKISNKIGENNTLKTKTSEELNKPVENVGSTDVSSGQSNNILTKIIETSPVSRSETKLIQSSPEKMKPASPVISPNLNNENNQEINIQENLDKTNAPVLRASRSSENSKRDDKVSTIVEAPKSKGPYKCYSLRKSIEFSPKGNEKEKITKGKRKSVTFASTARLRNDSQSGEISLNSSPPLKSRIISTSKNKSSGSSSTIDSEFDMSVTEAISAIPNAVSGAVEGRRNCHSTPIKKTQTEIPELKELPINNQGYDSKDSHIFACPGVPDHKLIRSRPSNISNNVRKRSRNEAEVNVVGCHSDKSNSSKRKRTVDKTINELSYDTLLDVSEIPLDKTIHKKKLIYHSTPINPLLEKKTFKLSLSDRRRSLLNNQKDKIIQVSKTFFATSSEITASMPKKKSGDELSTSYSYGGKLQGSKGSVTSNSYSKRPKKEEVRPRGCSRRLLDSQSSVSGDSLKSTVDQSSDGNKESNEKSSRFKTLRSGITSKLSQTVDETSYSHRVHFRNFSSHIDSEISFNKNSNSCENSTSISDIRRSIDEFDLTPGTPSLASIDGISQNSDSKRAFSERTPSAVLVSRSDDDIRRNVMVSNVKSNESLSAINHQTLEESSIPEYTIATPAILSLQFKIGLNEETFEGPSKDQPKSLKRRKKHILEDNRLTINGKLYVPPKTKFNEKWVSLELFNFCVNKLKNKYDLEATVLAERIVSHLCATVSAVKLLNDYSDVETHTLVLRSILKKYDICPNILNYYSFIMKFTPFEFQRKVLPMGGYFGSFKTDSVTNLKIGDPIITGSEIITIS